MQRISEMLPPDMVIRMRGHLDQDWAALGQSIADNPFVFIAVLTVIDQSPAEILASLNSGPDDVTSLVARLARLALFTAIDREALQSNGEEQSSDGRSPQGS